MANDREILREIWEGKLPVCFTLSPDEVKELQQPDPFYILVPRLSYFPLVTDKVKKYFGKFLDEENRDGDMWLEYDGQPLKWHFPIGVLFDLTMGDEVRLPWNIVVRFDKFPENKIFRFGNKEAIESYFMACVKEADNLKHRGTVINGMQKKDHNQLWLGLQNDKFDQFWAVNRKLMEGSSDQDAFKHIPFRFYVDDGYKQKLVKPIGEDGQRRTLQDLLEEVFPNEKDLDLEADISQLEAPTFTTINRGPPEPMLRLNWTHKVNLIGEKVMNPMIHCCDKCTKPILIYGRMIPCKHVFCLACAKQEQAQCPRCLDKVTRVEQTGLGTVFMCAHGGTRYGSSGCRRTYLSQRDLQAHINHRHVASATPPADAPEPAERPERPAAAPPARLAASKIDPRSSAAAPPPGARARVAPRTNLITVPIQDSAPPPPPQQVAVAHEQQQQQQQPQQGYYHSQYYSPPMHIPPPPPPQAQAQYFATPPPAYSPAPAYPAYGGGAPPAAYGGAAGLAPGRANGQYDFGGAPPPQWGAGQQYYR